MLLQTNSYIVPQDKRAEHARLLRRFRQVLTRIGCDSFEVYEQVGSNWNAAEVTGRVVQIMRFRDRRHQLAVQAAERNDPVAQAVIAEFCQLINFPYQQQQGLFAVGFYNAVIGASPARAHETPADEVAPGAAAAAGAEALAPNAEQVEPPASASGRAEAAPTLQAEEPVFAEGTEGIIAAAEQLSDEALDAGGDAAVADAIAAASSNGAADVSENRASDHVDEAGGAVAEELQAEPPQAEPAVQVEPSVLAETSPLEEAPAPRPAGDDLDLAALLDPHLGEDNGRHESSGNGGGHREWGGPEGLALDGGIDENASGPEEDGACKDAALDAESEHDRNHVSQ